MDFRFGYCRTRNARCRTNICRINLDGGLGQIRIRVLYNPYPYSLKKLSSQSQYQPPPSPISWNNSESLHLDPHSTLETDIKMFSRCIQSNIRLLACGMCVSFFFSFPLSLRAGTRLVLLLVQ